MNEPTGRDVRERVTDASWALAASGQEDMIWGHVAIRDDDGRGVWMKAAGWSLYEVTPDRVLLVDWDGTRVEGAGKPHIESHIHLQVMRARPDVHASVHTHPAVVNAFSALNVPMRAISHDGVLFADPQIPRFELTGDLIGDTDRGRQLAVALGEARACLMPRHGLLAVGGSEAAAVMHAAVLTAACRVLIQAMSAGPIECWSDDTEIADKTRHAWPDSQLRAGYDYLVRRGRNEHVGNH